MRSIVNKRHHLFDWVGIKKNEPFATNPVIKQLLIAINEPICADLKLTRDEQYAMIAHEIGHLLDKSIKDTNNPLRREHNADEFAVKLNLTKELKTGLEKLIESGCYPTEVEDMKKRVERLP